MQNRPLERDTWQRYFDDASKHLGTKLVRVEVLADELGDQDSIVDRPLSGLSYDPKGDRFEVMAEGIDHLVSHPREIYVDDEGGELHEVTIIDDEGRKQFVRIGAGSEKYPH